MKMSKKTEFVCAFIAWSAVGVVLGVLVSASVVTLVGWLWGFEMVTSAADAKSLTVTGAVLGLAVVLGSRLFAAIEVGE